MLRCRVQACFDTGEARRLALPPRVVGDPREGDGAGLAHLAEQTDGCALVFNFVFVDEAAHGECVKDLPNRLGMVFIEKVLDRRPDVGDLGLGAAVSFGFYVAST
jgi:hypothetical protein